MDNWTGTVKELADLMKIEYGQANVLVNLLLAKGIATKVGERKSQPSGRGKASGVFSLPRKIELSL